jgi:hypothetical protein
MKEYLPKNPLRVDISKIFDDSLITPLDFTPDSTLFSPTTDLVHLKRYEELSSLFFKEGVQYTRQKLLFGLALQLKKVLNTNQKLIFSKLVFVANLFLFNEFEVLFWSVLLKNTVAFIAEYQRSALFAGYLTKSTLNSEILPFEAYLNTLYVNFKMDFSNWQLVCDLPSDVNIKEVNSRFRELRNFAEKREKDYESMVEELMPIPRRKMSTFSESHISDISLNDYDVVQVLEEYEGMLFDAI